MFVTTLNKILKRSLVRQGMFHYEGFLTLLRYLDKTEADDEPLLLETIFNSNGLLTAIDAFDVIDGHNREFRLFACACAHGSLPFFEKHNPNDNRLRIMIETAALYAEGLATMDEMSESRDNWLDTNNSPFFSEYTGHHAAHLAARAAVAAASSRADHVAAGAAAQTSSMSCAIGFMSEDAQNYMMAISIAKQRRSIVDMIAGKGIFAEI